MTGRSAILGPVDAEHWPSPEAMVRAHRALDDLLHPRSPNLRPCVKCGGLRSSRWEASEWKYNTRRGGRRAYLCADCAETMASLSHEERVAIARRAWLPQPPVER